MAGEEIFVSNSIISVGSAFLFFALYYITSNKQETGFNFLNFIFLLLSLGSILIGFTGQQIAYTVSGLPEQSDLINTTVLLIIPYLILGIVLLIILDAVIKIPKIFNLKI